MSSTAFTHFLGERDQTFLITPALIPELEHVTGAGIGTLFKRVAEGHFRFLDLTQTIRIGLIGGGMSPEKAAHLCATYVEGRPLAESQSIALGILERLWLGAPVVEALITEIERANAAA